MNHALNLIDFRNNIPENYLNSSAKKIQNKRKLRFLKYINNSSQFNFDDNQLMGIITPDKNIIPGKTYKPAYLVFKTL